jgi:hypothetical protein
MKLKNLHRFAIIGSMFCAPSAALAQADCEPEFVQSSQTVTLSGIDVSAGSSASETFQIRVRNDGAPGGKCPATLRVAKLSTSPSPSTITYALQSGGQLLQILSSENQPGTAASDLTIAQLSPGTNGLSIPFRLTVPSGWGLASGSQVEDLIILLLDESGTVVDTMLLSIALTVQPAVEVRVVGVTGQNPIARINLGILDPQAVNISDPFGLRIWSTSPYTVSFRSENEGKLVHESVNASIDYQLLMDQQRVNVSGAAAAFVPRGTDSLGDLHPMGVRVEPFRARAGNYSDRVEVTVTAN